MRLPRDWSGEELIRRLARVGYTPTRQSGSHVRLTRTTSTSEHHVTVPRHTPLKIGTLNAILSEIADHLEMTKDDLLRELL